MAEMRHGLMVAVFVLATAFTLAEENARRPKPVASLIPPAPFVTTPLTTTTPKTTTSHTNTTTVPPTPHNTTANVTTVPPTPHNTTANVTTVPPTPHNTTANVTTVPPTPHNTTANVTTVPPTPHNTTANVTTVPPTPHNTTANVTTVPPTPHNTTTPYPTTPAPTPKTNVTKGNYTVLDGNKLCIMVQAVIQVHVNNSQAAGTYIVPESAKGTGKCESNTASLKITFTEGYISMNFFKNDTTNMVSVNAVAVNLKYAFKAGVLTPVVANNNSVQLFTMATGHSYSCKSESVFMGNGTYLEFSQDRMQSFNFTKNQFGPIDLCKADQPDYRVAIGVGVVLLILIIIVVVAYLISRRKRTDGYQTL
ncbi:macrosialin [Ictalurus furcatus]|uniref:macrosialin n=1 Tax=Ictalurus furcatus TaxID=66913 RepID=UPI002350F378|nr:macrosialin [Ictalurus furcatus]